MATMHIDVVSAEASIYSGEAELVVLPGIMGELGIYPRHTPLITQIKAGTVRIKVPGKDEEEMVYVQGGFLEVQPDHINVLSDTAIRAADLDEAKVLEAKRIAEEALRARTEKQDIASVEAELAAISAQLQAIQKLRKIRGVGAHSPSNGRSCPTTFPLTREEGKNASMPSKDSPMPISVVILAAGQGKRMKSDLPKVLQPLAGRPLLQHVLDTARELDARGHPRRLRPRRRTRCRSVRSAGPELGAAGRAARHRSRGDAGHAGVPDDHLVLVLYGDVPLVEAATLRGWSQRRASTRSRSERADEGPDRLWPHRARRRGQRGAHRRAQGRQRQGARDPRGQHRPHGRAGDAPARLARQAEERQRPGRVLPDRHRRDGGEEPG